MEPGAVGCGDDDGAHRSPLTAHCSTLCICLNSGKKRNRKEEKREEGGAPKHQSGNVLLTLLPSARRLASFGFQLLPLPLPLPLRITST